MAHDEWGHSLLELLKTLMIDLLFFQSILPRVFCVHLVNPQVSHRQNDTSTATALSHHRLEDIEDK